MDHRFGLWIFTIILSFFFLAETKIHTLPSAFLSAQGVLVEGNCSFNVNDDLKDAAPLFVQHETFEWVVPDSDGVVRLSNGQFMDMYCIGVEFSAQHLKNLTKVTAQCLQNKYFLVNGVITPLSELVCTNWPTYTVRRTGRPCNGGTDLLEVGFIVDDGKEKENDRRTGNNFLQTMDICHDENNEVTRYVHHVLNPSSAMYQHGVGRPQFIEGDFYGGKKVNKIYTKVQQNETISGILGMDASPYFDDSISIFLARGHMAAKVDFIFGAQQRSTFYFVNVAPQWQAFNAGNWERVENGVRNFVAKNELTTDCYTGTWGVSTLPDANGIQQPLYLDFDENNNGLIPVPMLYFRIIIDRKSRKGIVLVGVNNPHATLDQILKDYVICPDISDEIDWIDWDKHNIVKGYSYACLVEDFIAVVDHLPLAKLKTTGLLGIPDANLYQFKFL